MSLGAPAVSRRPPPRVDHEKNNSTLGPALVVAAGLWCCTGGVLADQVSAANVRAHRQYEMRLAAYQRARAQADAESAAYHKALAAWRRSRRAWQAQMAAVNPPTNVVD